MPTLSQISFKFSGQTAFYRGKVRDVYTIGNKALVMVVSDRISAFDVVLPRAIPYKGEVLNRIASYFLDATSDIVPNWVLGVPDPQATIGLPCHPLKIEMVIRGYLSGHAWRTYKSGERSICGVRMPENMSESDPFPEPIITPTTKASEGHDADISREDILKSGIVTPEIYEQVEKYTRQLYKKGCDMAARQGLILVDTKYEFGMYDGKVYLIDEIHTPDSSRYFYADGYAERQQKGEAQKQLSKEFLRQWLIQHNFQGLEGQKVPEMTDEIVEMVSNRYIELFEKITGETFIKHNDPDPEDRIFKNVENFLAKL